MPRRDTEAAQRRRERKAQKAKEKACRESDAETKAMRETLDLVCEGGKAAQPQTNIPKCVEGFEKALAKNEKNAEAWYCLGRTIQEQGDRETAIQHYDKCLENDPQHVTAMLQQALCHEFLGNLDAAMVNYSRILDVDPRHDVAYNLRGAGKLSTRGGLGLKLRHVDFVAVEQDFLSAVRCNENNYYALCNLGRLYDEHGKYEKAIEYYTKSMEVKDDYIYSAYRRGCCCLTAVEEALRKAEQARDTDPTRVVLNESCAAVPFYTAAPRDERKIEGTKHTPAFFLPPINQKGSRLTSATSSSSSATSSSSSAASFGRMGSATNSSSSSSSSHHHHHHHHGQGGGDVAAAVAQSEHEKQVRQQVEKEIEEEKQFTKLKQWLSLAISDFSRLLAPLQEVEDRQKELATLVHRASCYLFEGELEKAEEDYKFVHKHLEAYKELPTPPSTSYEAVKAAYTLIEERLEAAREKRRKGQPISPFASGAPSLTVALLQKKSSSSSPSTSSSSATGFASGSNFSASAASMM